MKIKLKTFLCLTLSMFSALMSLAQCSGDILTTQIEVNNWLATNSNCTIIEDDITIGSVDPSGNSDISDLSGFMNFTQVTGDLIIINNNQLTSLNGLNNIQRIMGELRVENNSMLPNLEGLNGLIEIYGAINIRENLALINFSGLNNLQISYDFLFIHNNPSLENISALGTLETPNGQMEISITNNGNLGSLDGLQNISGTEGGIRIIDNDALVDLTGLEGINESFYLYIEDNDNLTSLNGIYNLAGLVDGLRIVNNDALLNLDELEIQFFAGADFMFNGGINISGNQVLNDISGLQSYVDLTMDFDIIIQDNPNLSDCRSISICEYVNNGNTISVSNNAGGCNSNLDIEASCNGGFLNGKLTYDSNQDCILNVEDTLGLAGWKILAESPQHSRIAFTDFSGNYNIALLEGEYSISLNPPNPFWGNCPNTQNYNITVGDTTEVNLLSSVDTECPLLEVELGAPLLRRCFDNDFTVNWSNSGGATEDAYIVIYTNDFLENFQSSTPFTFDVDSNLVFQLGDLAIGEIGTISFSALLSCEAELDQVVCLSANIFPQRTCTIDNQTYEGAVLFLEGRCENDSLFLFINNAGMEDMAGPSVYRLYKNAVLVDTAFFELTAGETFELAIPADGCTYRLETDQVEDFPLETFPSITIEGCRVVGQSFAKGFFLMHRVEDYGAPFHRLCLPVIGAYDPNDKQGFPLGFGEQHFIEPTQEIEYLIRFQNTGSDTAFNIVVLDTLSENFDLTSLELGTSSHPLKFSVTDDRTLQFSFENIMLPDSNVNQLASNGFFKYKVKPVANLPIGTTFENSASIYFDFNAPVKTNTTFHSIGIATTIDTTEVVLCEGENYEGITYAQNAVLVDTLAYSVFENISLTNIEVIIPTETVVDTLLEIGMLYNGIVYETDTTFQELLIDQYGCDSIVITNVIIQPVSTFDLEKYIDVTVSPNPFREKIQFEIKQVDFNFGKLELYDALGKNILTKTFDRNTFELEGAQLMQGIYFYRIILDGKYEKSGRVVKE